MSKPTVVHSSQVFHVTEKLIRAKPSDQGNISYNDVDQKTIRVVESYHREGGLFL
jgi:hypothetical protein